jgi:predicted kinase
MYGLPASGKTACAKTLQRTSSAVRFTLDEWMLQLFPQLRFDDAEYAQRVEAVQDLIWEVASQVLANGLDVVLDWNFWSVERRRWAIDRARTAGADCVLHLIPADVDLAASRAERRNAGDGADFHRLTREDVEFQARLMEPPTSSEGLSIHPREPDLGPD